MAHVPVVDEGTVGSPGAPASSSLRVLVVCLRDEHVVHWFDADRRVLTGPVVRHAAVRSAAETLGDLRSSIVATGTNLIVDAAGRTIEMTLALNGDLDHEAGLVLATSAWTDRDVRPAEHLVEGLGSVRLRLVGAEPLLAEAAAGAGDLSPDVVTGVFQLAYRMTLHLAIGSRLTVGDGVDRVNHGLNHTPLAGNERLCACGQVGCLASIIGSNSLVDRYVEAGGELSLRTGRAVVEAVGRGDPIARQVVEDSVRWIAEALSPWIDLLGIRQLIITGPGAAEPVGRSVLETLAEALPPRQQALRWQIIPLQRVAEHLHYPASD